MTALSRDPDDYTGGTYSPRFPAFGPIRDVVDVIPSHTSKDRAGNLRSTCEIRLSCGHHYQRFGSEARWSGWKVRARCPDCSLEGES